MELPFEQRVPAAATRAAMDELRARRSPEAMGSRVELSPTGKEEPAPAQRLRKGARGFESVEALMADLQADH